MKDQVVKLLAALGYTEITANDQIILDFALQKVENFVKNEINWNSIPKGLEEVVVCRVIGEFLLSKKTFSPDELAMLDLSAETVKQIQAGDTNFVLGVGEGADTDQKRLDTFINFMLSYGADQFGAFRKIRW